MDSNTNMTQKENSEQEWDVYISMCRIKIFVLPIYEIQQILMAP